MLRGSTAARDITQVKADNPDMRDSRDQNDVPASQDIDIVKIIPKPSIPAEAPMLPSPVYFENSDSVKSKIETNKPKDGQGADDDPTSSTAVTLEIEKEPSGQCTGVSTLGELLPDPRLHQIDASILHLTRLLNTYFADVHKVSNFWFLYAILMALAKSFSAASGLYIRFSSSPTPASASNPQGQGRKLPKPKSLHPASILSCADGRSGRDWLPHLRRCRESWDLLIRWG